MTRTPGGDAIRKRVPAAIHQLLVRSPLTTADSFLTGTHTLRALTPWDAVPSSPNASARASRRVVYVRAAAATSPVTAGSVSRSATVAWRM
ncbi:hypothetical protein [Streptomyces atroolivaceus]|uniref:hypothetical protein n=1 Tax=Streptomyces atroolivaceus TaxID=66869 RepID=UPI002023D344|nr:hypothetical protein [Streptomyces atroolivaceus]